MLRYAVTIYLFTAVVLTSFISTYMLSKGKALYTKAFAALNFSICIYLLGYMLELNSTTLEQMALWNQVQYLGLAFFPALWLGVVLLYTKQQPSLGGTVLFAWFAIPVLTLILRATNDYHHLYYRAMELRLISGFEMLYLVKGPWYYVQSAYMLFSVTLSSLLLYREYRRSQDVDRSRYLFVLAASAMPHLGVVLILFNLLLAGLDYGALLLPISLSLTTLSILRGDFLEVKSLARENIFETSPDAMLLLDNGNRVVDYNRAALGFFSFQTLDHVKVEDLLSDVPALISVFQNKTPQVFELGRNGQRRYFEISSLVIHNHYGSVVGTLKSLRDITEKKIMEERLRIAATIDELSGLNNRQHFMELAEQEFEQARGSGTALSAMMMDIDHFKSVNDTYGHAAGDAVIREIGRLMRSSFDQGCILGRLGGEEFAVIMPNTSAADAGMIAEQLRQAMAGTEVISGTATIKFSVSSGVTELASQVGSLDELLRHADQALYASKGRGRNQITVIRHGDMHSVSRDEVAAATEDVQ